MPVREKLSSGVMAMGLALLLSAGGALAGAHTGSGDHADHAMHQMTGEQMAELRREIPLYGEYTDEQIMMGMSRMKNSGGMVSAAGMAGDVGVLALAHGFNERGNEQFKTAWSSTASQYPTAYGFGMAMMTSSHIQAAIDELEAAGAKKIVVVPTTTADNTTLVRQWQYIFGAREDSAYLDVPRVRSNVPLVWTDTPTRHPLMASIMLDYARSRSQDAAKEVVLILGHGPQDPTDNEKELAILRRHAAFIKDQGGFHDVLFANVQDDAPTAMRKANVDMVRGWIAKHNAEGHRTIVVTTLLTDSGAMGRLNEDTAELGAEFVRQGLMEHPLFSDWIETVVAQGVAAGDDQA
jgi:sirohydrochlorin ferrochelatase